MSTSYSGELKINFQDGWHGGHLGFPTDTILAIFDLQVTLMLPSKFGVNWPFGGGMIGVAITGGIGPLRLPRT